MLYNRLYSYSAGKRNGQHFVEDAFAAMGIKWAPEKGSQLDMYLQVIPVRASKDPSCNTTSGLIGKPRSRRFLRGTVGWPVRGGSGIATQVLRREVAGASSQRLSHYD